MITLGIETSCDETSVALLKDGKKILSNVVVSSHERARKVRRRGARDCLAGASGGAFGVSGFGRSKSEGEPEAIDLVAVTQGPGLMGSLLVGLSAAKALGVQLEKAAHRRRPCDRSYLFPGFLIGSEALFSVLGLIVSGGHTLLVGWTARATFGILGRTIDDAAGEAFDKVAKILGF